jgi:tetratricopeptide (TPR) repeat protein
VSRPHLRRALRSSTVLLAAALVAASVLTLGCGGDRGSDDAPVNAPSSGLPPLPTSNLVAATDEQLAFYRAATESIENSDIDTAMTALIALQRTEAPSAERARGMLTLAQIYLQQTDYDRVALMLDQLDAAAPPTAGSALLRGRLYLAIDRPAEAEASIERATRLDLDGIRSLAVLSAVQRNVGRLADADETELAMERRILHHAHELAEHPRPERAFVVLDSLDPGFQNADAARAASSALVHEDASVQAHTLEVLSRIGGPAIAGRLRRYSSEGGAHAERAEATANQLEGVVPE